MLQCPINDPNYPGLLLIFNSLEDPGADLSTQNGTMTITYSDGRVVTCDDYVNANGMVEQVTDAIQAKLGS